jgi:hypothetical protein
LFRETAHLRRTGGFPEQASREREERGAQTRLHTHTHTPPRPCIRPGGKKGRKHEGKRPRFASTAEHRGLKKVTYAMLVLDFGPRKRPGQGKEEKALLSTRRLAVWNPPSPRHRLFYPLRRLSQRFREFVWTWTVTGPPGPNGLRWRSWGNLMDGRVDPNLGMTSLCHQACCIITTTILSSPSPLLLRVLLFSSMSHAPTQEHSPGRWKVIAAFVRQRHSKQGLVLMIAFIFGSNWR